MCSPNCKLVTYADDVTLLSHFNCAAADCTQLEIDNICTWANCNKLFINITKCAVLNITNATDNIFNILAINGTIIIPVEYICILGVCVNNNLYWNLHHAAAYKKACRGLYAVKILHKFGLSGKSL